MPFQVVNGNRIFTDSNGNPIEDDSSNRPMIYHAELLPSSKHIQAPRDYVNDYTFTKPEWMGLRGEDTLIANAHVDREICQVCKRASETLTCEDCEQLIKLELQ